MKLERKEDYEEALKLLKILLRALSDYENENTKIEIDYEEIARTWTERGQEMMNFIVRSGFLAIEGDLIAVSNSTAEQIGEHMRHLVDCN